MQENVQEVQAIEVQSTPTPQPAPGPAPDNYLAYAIWAIIMFWPTGIAAIINASRVNSLWAEGKYIEAIDASEAAQHWSRTSITWTLIIMGSVTLFYIVYIALLVNLL